MKKGYWLAWVFAEIYSFAGLFASIKVVPDYAVLPGG